MKQSEYLSTIKTLRGGHTRYRPRVTRHTWHRVTLLRGHVVTTRQLLTWLIYYQQRDSIVWNTEKNCFCSACHWGGGRRHSSQCAYSTGRNGISAGISSAEKLAMHTTHRTEKIIDAPRTHVSSPPRRHGRGSTRRARGKLQENRHMIICNFEENVVLIFWGSGILDLRSFEKVLSTQCERWSIL